jgi:hypothetical protein
MAHAVPPAERTHPEPETLAELQAMSTGEIHRVRAFYYRGEVAISKVMRRIVVLANDVRSWPGEEAASSVREFWYNPVKPIVQKAFPEHLSGERISESFNDYMVDKLTAYLSEIVLNNTDDVETEGITYRSLGIVDDSRQWQIRSSTIENGKILFVEKDAAYRKLEPLAETYELSIVSGGGNQSTAAIEAMAGQIDPDTSYQLFVVTDHDPSGFSIVDDFHQRAGKLGINIVSIDRVGISPNQVDSETITQQRFELPEDDWGWSETIDGRYGLEIEAVSAGDNGAEELRRIVVDELRPYIDEQSRYERDLRRATKRTAESAAGTVTDRIIGPTRDRLYEGLLERGSEILQESELVGRGFAVDIDAARGDGATNPLLPTVPKSGTLHEAAIVGDSYAIRSDEGSKALRRQLIDDIESGAIDLDEFAKGEDKSSGGYGAILPCSRQTSKPFFARVRRERATGGAKKRFRLTERRFIWSYSRIRSLPFHLARRQWRTPPNHCGMLLEVTLLSMLLVTGRGMSILPNSLWITRT